MDSLQQIPLDRIIARPQVRSTFDDEGIAELAESLLAVGQLQPIRVQPSGDKFLVIAGERRLRAAIKAGLPTIAAMVEPKSLADCDVRQRQLIENCQRRDLSPREKARAIRDLKEGLKLSVAEVATRLGMASGTISKLLAILALPESIQAQIDAGSIPVSSASDLARINDPERQADLARQLASGEATRDAVSGAVKAARKAAGSKPASEQSRVAAVLPGKRTITLSGPSLDLEALIAWLEELLSKARKARPTGVQLASFLAMLRDQARAG